MKKFLFIQTASIGDVILITPAIENLHSSIPDAIIDVLIKKGCENLFNNHHFINNIKIFDKSKNKYKNLIKITKEVRKEKYDAVLCFHRFFSGGFITAFSKADYRVGFNKNPFSFFFNKKLKHNIGNQNNFEHEKDRNLLLVSWLTHNNSAKIKLYPSENDCNKIAKYTNCKYLCIAPASLWFTKQFPASKWIDFINKINDDFKVYLLGSNSDKNICNEIINNSINNNIDNLCGKLDFLETAALMKKAVMNFANDSAPVHLASAVNAPVTVIYCSTVPEFGFTPLSDKSFIIQTKKQLKCRPCGLHGHKKCPEKHFNCAYTINTDELLKTILL